MTISKPAISKPALSNPLEQLTIDDLRQRTSVKWRAHPDDVLPLWVAEMDVPLAEPVAAALMRASSGATPAIRAGPSTTPRPCRGSRNEGGGGAASTWDGRRSCRT